MSPNPPRSRQFPSTRTRVHRDLLADNEAIRHELADRLAGIGVGDFVDFVRVEPDLALATAYNRGREPLLCTQVDPRDHLSLADLEVNGHCDEEG